MNVEIGQMRMMREGFGRHGAVLGAEDGEAVLSMRFLDGVGAERIARDMGLSRAAVKRLVKKDGKAWCERNGVPHTQIVGRPRKGLSEDVVQGVLSMRFLLEMPVSAIVDELGISRKAVDRAIRERGDEWRRSNGIG